MYLILMESGKENKEFKLGDDNSNSRSATKQLWVLKC